MIEKKHKLTPYSALKTLRKSDKMSNKDLRFKRDDKIAILGGSGFIGTNLGRELHRRGFSVSSFDIVDPPEEVASLYPHEYADVTSPDSLKGKFDGFKTLILLAGLLGRQCQMDEELGWRTNVQGLMNVFEEIKGGQVQRVIFTSSSMIFEEPPRVFPIRESVPARPRCLYGTSKVFGEALLDAACKRYGLEGVSFRFWTVYGPGPASGEKGHFIATWLERAAAGEPLVIFGDGKQTVDLTHVDDVVDAIILSLGLKMEAGRHQAFNIGCGQEATVLEVAQWVREVVPDVELIVDESISCGQIKRLADYSKAARMMGYAPRVSPEQGIKDLFQRRESQAAPDKKAGAASRSPRREKSAPTV